MGKDNAGIGRLDPWIIPFADLAGEHVDVDITWELISLLTPGMLYASAIMPAVTGSMIAPGSLATSPSERISSLPGEVYRFGEKALDAFTAADGIIGDRDVAMRHRIHRSIFYKVAPRRWSQRHASAISALVRRHVRTELVHKTKVAADIMAKGVVNMIYSLSLFVVDASCLRESQKAKDQRQ